jgi:hypothetical protein
MFVVFFSNKFTCDNGHKVGTEGKTLSNTGVLQPSPLKRISPRDSSRGPQGRRRLQLAFMVLVCFIRFFRKLALRMSFSLQLQKESLFVLVLQLSLVFVKSTFLIFGF